ncbi:MAG: hypothetical protein LBU50_00430 [Cellulomonas sp.]|nr:hypothetical protein [Cellulomonas sp.]
MRRAKLLRLVGVVVAVTIVASACASDHNDSSASGGTGSVPSFEGPYAADFEGFYRATDSDFARNVLSDSQITDAEYAEMEERFRTCLADDGITFDGFRDDGGYTTSLAPDDGDTEAMITVCSESSGEDTVGALYTIMRSNPDNLDVPTIMAECLVRKGMRPSGYNGNAYSSEMESVELSDFSPDQQDILLSCSADPLGILGGQ